MRLDHPDDWRSFRVNKKNAVKTSREPVFPIQSGFGTSRDFFRQSAEIPIVAADSSVFRRRWCVHAVKAPPPARMQINRLARMAKRPDIGRRRRPAGIVYPAPRMRLVFDYPDESKVWVVCVETNRRGSAEPLCHTTLGYPARESPPGRERASWRTRRSAFLRRAGAPSIAAQREIVGVRRSSVTIAASTDGNTPARNQGGGNRRGRLRPAPDGLGNPFSARRGL